MNSTVILNLMQPSCGLKKRKKKRSYLWRDNFSKSDEDCIVAIFAYLVSGDVSASTRSGLIQVMVNVNIVLDHLHSGYFRRTRYGNCRKYDKMKQGMIKIKWKISEIDDQRLAQLQNCRDKFIRLHQFLVYRFRNADLCVTSLICDIIIKIDAT